jgi:flagellar hook-associated protein 3 FlgL
MRVSNLSSQMQLLQSLQAKLADLQTAQQQQSTGNRVNRPSDDPAATAEILRTSSALGAIAQFRKNASVVQTSLNAEDAVETTLGKVLDAAKSVAIGAGSAAPSDPVRQAAITQITDLIRQVTDLGNTQVGTNYIFGGFKTGAPPFQTSTPAGGTFLGTTAAPAEATVTVAGTAAPGVYQLTNDPTAPGSVTLTNLSDPTQTQTITGVTSGTTTLNFNTLGVSLSLGTGWSVATGVAPGSLNGDTIAVGSGVTYQGDSNQRQVQVDGGTTITANHTGDQVFGNVIASLQALLGTLASGTTAQINSAVAVADTAQTQVLGLQAETGAILQQIDNIGTALTARETTLVDRKAAAQQVDPNEAAVRLLNAQNALQQAYAATGRVLSLSLTDYLR